MASANGEIIPFVDDDQGEGIKDFFQNMHEIEVNMNLSDLMFGKSGPIAFSTETEARQLAKLRCELNQS